MSHAYESSSWFSGSGESGTDAGKITPDRDELIACIARAETAGGKRLQEKKAQTSADRQRAIDAATQAAELWVNTKLPLLIEKLSSQLEFSIEGSGWFSWFGHYLDGVSIKGCDCRTFIDTIVLRAPARWGVTACGSVSRDGTALELEISWEHLRSCSSSGSTVVDSTVE